MGSRITGFRRILAAAMAGCMTMGLIGCSQDGSNEVKTAGNHSTEQEAEKSTEKENEPAWQRYADDEITLDWYVNYSWFATPWGDNLVSETITEETGVNVNFITPFPGIASLYSYT